MLHWQLPECSAAVAGSDTEPQPQEVHCSFLNPGAKDPLEHGVHAELVVDSRMPCPGMHTHCVSFVVPVDVVVLFVGQGVHSALLLTVEKNPRGQSVQRESDPFLPKPGGH